MYNTPTNNEVQATIQRAARAAVKELDKAFPGGDRGGVNATFQATLQEVLLDMLKGNVPPVPRAGVSLPVLVVE